MLDIVKQRKRGLIHIAANDEPAQGSRSMFIIRLTETNLPSHRPGMKWPHLEEVVRE